MTTINHTPYMFIARILICTGSFGSVQLTLQYEESEATLNVTIHGCKGLRAMDSNGKSDPYVKVFLQPGNKMQRFQTKVVPKNLNPSYQETFSFDSLTLEAMEKKKLCVVVMDYDDFSKDDLIGATQVKLYEVIHSGSYEICIKRLLDDRSVPRSDAIVVDRGAVKLGLKYSTAKKGLLVSVIAASNIAGHLPKGECESLVKCHWMTRSLCVKDKTKVSPKTSSPNFTETLFFPASLHELSHSNLTVSVWEHRTFKDKVLGEIQFKSVSFWRSFVEDPSLTVEEWYALDVPLANSINKAP